MSKSQQKGWLSIREAAVQLGVPYPQVLRMVELGALESTRESNGRWLIRAESLERFVAETSRDSAEDDVQR
jgi:excisionase family DNA binding protein